ncbi:MAG: UDP-N-acetylmuramate--L-alanine ligase [Chloroflexi bacterium]|nr:UDP-N-acetylmuramate--L-alanine ligase [Chloroflexota bacterium]
MTQTTMTTKQAWQTRLAAQDATLHIHLLGIGGAGLSAIAQVLVEMGFRVSGSDRQLNANMQRLAALGVTIFAEQRAANLTSDQVVSPDVILISSAISQDNTERQAAEQLAIPVVKRSEFLPVLLGNRQLIAVAGTAGKSTTTAMIVKVLREAGIEAGYIIGTELPGYGNAAAGKHAYFVLEADEYDRMFLGFSPSVAVITNIEWDHPDCYPTPASFRQAFRQFTESVQRNGAIISCADDPGAEQLRTEQQTHGPQWITYGTADQATWQAKAVTSVSGAGYQADIVWHNRPQGRLTLQVPGLHNLRNALAAIAVAGWYHLPIAAALESLQQFGGTARRFEYKGEAQGVTVIDDYAHHPAKIGATLSAARKRYPERRIWAIFQPHTYSRTKHLLQEMADSFADADQVIVTDIYAAREQDDGSVGAKDIVAASSHGKIQHVSGLTATATYLAQQVQAGDVVITMGAGDSDKIAPLLLAKLKSDA